MLDFSGRAVAVTGAAGGIGSATARLFAQSGAMLALNDLDADGLALLAGGLSASGTDCLVHAGDARTPAMAPDFAEACRARFGGIDHLVVAAGIYRAMPVSEMSDAEWSDAIAINLDAVFRTCRAFLPLMREGGSIVTIASIAAHRGSHEHAHYAAAKGGVLSFTRSLAREVAPRLRVNAVSPGLIDTPMVRGLMAGRGARMLEETPLGRLGTPEEVAGVIAFLCSPLAGFVTGETVRVNGGLDMSD